MSRALSDTILSSYSTFIEECKQKLYDEATHRHHIFPKFMGGADEDENMIDLSYEDHYKAHWILANCFPENHYCREGNLRACGLLAEWAFNDHDLREAISKSRSGKCFKSKEKLLEHSEMMVGNQHRLGIPHTQQVKEKIARSNRLRNIEYRPLPKGCFDNWEKDVDGFTISRELYRFCPKCDVKITYSSLCELRTGGEKKTKCRSCTMKGRKFSDNHRQALKLAASRRDNSNIGKYDRTNWKNPNSKSVRNIELNKIFSTMKEASEFENVSIDVLRRYIREGKYERIAS